MKKELEEKIISRFPEIMRISRVKKFEGFIIPHYSDLYECYNNYSVYKARAYEYCKELCNRVWDFVGYENIISWGISSYNIMQFSYVINFTYQDKNIVIILQKITTLYTLKNKASRLRG